MKPWIWIAIAASFLLIAGLVGSVVLMAFSLLGVMDHTDAHACALSAVRHSVLAVRMLGRPITQQGFTSGSTSRANGELTEDVRFTVRGPLGTAYVIARGKRSPIESRLDVLLGSNGSSVTIYSGPFDCRALHRGLILGAAAGAVRL
ncbi:MAG TPA: cytochrome c oxidase assembly factor Coa1 family protein [Candidatus Binatia bacterium]|nr:cytochrome c oxidase assembly factor Coa1 family protein [Candidatus Binatia bacterium]